MKLLTLVAALVIFGFSAAEKYTDRYDDIDVDEIIANRRLLIPYLKCTLDQGKCTAEGKELKLNVRDAIQTSCEKCTDQQRTKARKVVNFVKNNEKDYWAQLTAKYDPGDKYKESYEAFLAATD